MVTMIKDPMIRSGSGSTEAGCLCGRVRFGIDPAEGQAGSAGVGIWRIDGHRVVDSPPPLFMSWFRKFAY